MSIYTDMVYSYPFFQALDKDTLAQIDSLNLRWRARRFVKDQVLYYPEYRVPFFIVKGGRLVEYHDGINGQRNILNEYLGSNIGGPREDNQLFLEAERPSEIIYLPEDQSWRLIDIPEVLRNWSGVRDRREARQASMRSLLAMQRLAKFLLDATGRSGDNTVLDYSQQEIAYRLYAARETMNKYMVQLRKEGLITYSGQNSIKVLDTQRLRDIAEE